MAAIALALAQLLGTADQTFLLLYVGSITSFVSTYFVSMHYADRIAASPIDHLRTSTEVAIWCNKRMQMYSAFNAVADRGASAFSRGMRDGNAEWENEVPVDDGAGVTDSDGSPEDDEEYEDGEAQLAPDGTIVRNETEEQKHVRLFSQLANHASSLGLPLESADSLSLEELEAERDRIINTVRIGYEHALERFAGQEVAAMMAAAFYQHHYPFRYQECVCYARALRIMPSVDTRFFIHSRLQRMQQSDDNGLGPVERLMFDRELRKNTHLRVDAYRLMQNLWDTLAEPTPDLIQIEVTGMALQSTLSRLDVVYNRLLELNPESTSALRGYAQHLTDVVN